MNMAFAVESMWRRKAQTLRGEANGP